MPNLKDIDLSGYPKWARWLLVSFYTILAIVTVILRSLPERTFIVVTVGLMIAAIVGSILFFLVAGIYRALHPR